MGNSECSVEKPPACEANPWGQPSGSLPVAGQSARYLVAEEELLPDARRSRHRAAEGGYSEASRGRGAVTPDGNAVPTECSTGYGSSVPSPTKFQFEEASSVPSPVPEARRLRDLINERPPSQSHLDTASADPLCPPSPGRDDNCDLRIWRTLPDHQAGESAPSLLGRAVLGENTPETATQLAATAAATAARGPGRSAAKDYAPAARAAVASEEMVASATSVNAQMSYFDLDVGESPEQDSEHAMITRERRRFTFRSGATYDGEWLGGVRDGIGVQIWPDRTEYVGEWRLGRAGGLGTMRHPDNDVFIGQWVNGRAHGHGVYRFQGGSAVYEGEFLNDMRDGHGVELWVDGSWYAGDFKKGQKDGAGQHTWPDGTKFEGQWKCNDIHGAGHYEVQDGPSYNGQWQDSTIHGMGSYHWADGQKYEGSYDMDRKHGFGILYLPNETCREGFWSQGEAVGRKAFRPVHVAQVHGF